MEFDGSMTGICGSAELMITARPGQYNTERVSLLPWIDENLLLRFCG